MKDQTIKVPTVVFNSFKADLDGFVFHRDLPIQNHLQITEIKFIKSLKKHINPTIIILLSKIKLTPQTL